jgi:8-oxo-dGTP pyrophosphatase MutT (NUDIX family)
MSYSGAGFIILSPDCARTLLIRDARSNKWGFPKGHREKDDADDLATAIRECYEETSLCVTDYKVCSDVFRVSKGSQSYLFRYVMIFPDRMNCIRIHPDFSHEIGECCWVPILDLLDNTQLYPGNKYLRTWISDLRQDISKKSIHYFKKLRPSADRREGDRSGAVLPVR